MARKIAKVEIIDRGERKKFLITEMSATEAENWALELFFAMANTGVEIPDDLAEMGFAGLAQIGLSALGKIPFEKAKPLMDRMMECVQFIPDPDNEMVVRFLLESDIEEVTTRLKLRKEVWNLHTGFLRPAST